MLDPDGVEYMAFPVREGQRFTVRFVHSVNKSPVYDTFEIRGRELWLVETRHYDFGAGMQAELPPGQTLSYAEDGAMVIGMETLMEELVYIVSPVSGHVLEINGTEQSLGSGENGWVRFSMKK